MKKKVLAIMLVAMSIMLISACGKKEKLYEIPDLSQYKTDYVGDSSNVINIVISAIAACLIRKTKRSEWIMKCFIIFYFIGNFSNRQK